MSSKLTGILFGSLTLLTAVDTASAQPGTALTSVVSGQLQGVFEDGVAA